MTERDVGGEERAAEEVARSLREYLDVLDEQRDHIEAIIDRLEAGESLDSVREDFEDELTPLERAERSA